MKINFDIHFLTGKNYFIEPKTIKDTNTLMNVFVSRGINFCYKVIDNCHIVFPEFPINMIESELGEFLNKEE